MDFHGFGRLESYEYGRFQHRAEAVILRDTLQQWAQAEEIENPPTWEDLLKLAYPGTQPYLDDEDPAFVVGRIDLEEHPRITRWRLNLSWSDWLRSIDAVSALVGEVLDEVEAGMAQFQSAGRVEGSLFHIRNVAIHPEFHGQAIGRRLIAHTLWMMHRGVGDVAVILVLPNPNPLGPAEPADQSSAEIRKLTRYYRGMGFTRSIPGPIVDGQPVPMHAFFGTEPLRVSGLHEIGVGE